MARSATYKHVFGVEQLSHALRSIAMDVRSKVLEDGVKEALQPVLVAAKRYARRSERTGALRASIIIKTKSYPGTGKAVGLVGPDNSYYRGGRRVSRTVAALAGADRPSKYAHLIELGHTVVAPKKGTSIRKGTAKRVRAGKKEWVPAKPFIRPAVLTTKGQQASGFFKGIERSFNRAVAKAQKG